MSYRIAGIVVADVEIEGEYQFERRQFGSNPEHLRLLAEWLIEQEVVEVVMESTGTILATGLGGTGTVLEANLPESGRRRPEVGNATSGASTIESQATRAQEGFPPMPNV